MNKPGWEIQLLRDRSWNCVVFTMDGKPVHFDDSKTAEASLNEFLRFGVNGKFRVHNVLVEKV